MNVVSLSPIATSSLVWCPRPSTWMLTVVCKATFQLEPGQSTLAAEQEPVIEADEFWDDSEKRSLRFANELVPTKPRAEVLLTGNAFAPGGQPVRSVTTRLAVAEVDKRIDVHLDRHFSNEGAVREGARFPRMPLVYERAGGGPDTWNPVGMAPGVRDGYGRVHLPNLQVPGTYLASPNDMAESIGYGPIAPTWPLRVQKLAGRKSTSFLRDLRSSPLPEGLDYAFFQAAPLDQRLEVLRDNERVLLENLNQVHSRLQTRLPGVRPRAFVEGRPGGPSALEMRADTLCIDTDRGICTLVFRGIFPLAHPSESGRVLIGMEQGAQNLTYAELEQLARGGSAAPQNTHEGQTPSEEVGLTLFVGLEASASPSETLPFARQPGPPKTFEPTQNPRPKGGLPFAGSSAESPQPTIEPPAEVRAPPVVLGASGARPVGNDSPWALGPPVREEVLVPLVPLVAAAPLSTEPAAPGVLGISNAAAAKSEWAPGQPQGSAPGTPVTSSDEGQGRGVSRAADTRDAVLLVWFDLASMRRFRKHKPFANTLDEVAKESTTLELNEAPLGDTSADIEDRQDVLTILTRALSTDAPGVVEAMERSVTERGIVVPPVTLCAGELTIPFDPAETLQITVAILTPHSVADDNLKAALQNAKDVLALPNLKSVPAMAEGMNRRVLEAFNRSKRAVTVESIEAQTERALLEQRAYQRRNVFGGKHLRGLLTMPGSKDPIPTYLPDLLTDQLPLFTRFRVRLIAEVRVAEDQYEPHPVALRVLALARVLDRPKRDRERP